VRDVAAAYLAGATELITAENKSAELFRTKLVKVVHISDVPT